MATKWSKVLLLGDSLTQFGFSKEGSWAAILADKLIRVSDIVNRGLSGYNTNFYLEELPVLMQDVDPKSVACVTLFLGANDCALADCKSGQHVPIKEFMKNMFTIVNEIKQRGIDQSRIIMLNPPPYNHERFCAHREAMGEVGRPSRSAESAACFASACSEIAKKLDVTFLDVHSLFSSKENVDQYFFDGLHFSTAGSELLAENLIPLVFEKVKQFNGWSEMQLNCPLWAEKAAASLKK